MQTFLFKIPFSIQYLFFIRSLTIFICLFLIISNIFLCICGLFCWIVICWRNGCVYAAMIAQQPLVTNTHVCIHTGRKVQRHIYPFFALQPLLLPFSPFFERRNIFLLNLSTHSVHGRGDTEIQKK